MSNTKITTLGECRYPSPIKYCTSDDAAVPAQIEWINGQPPTSPQLFELAGPRPKLFFDPATVRAGIVTCGGLCPGLNQVIRSLVLQLYLGYGVKEVLGFQEGYQGLDPARCKEPLALTLDMV